MAYRIEGWLEDSGSDGQRLLAGYRRDLAQRGGKVRKAAFKMRKDISHLDWIHKRLTQVTADDITAYVEDRIEAVEPSTVDRELDIFSAIFNKAIDSWGYHLAVNPMNGVERPKYFNERDRRFRGDEEQRLLGAMRELDKQEAIAREVERRIAEEFGETVFSSLSARKKVLAARRQELSAVVISAKPVAWLEAFLLFQLMTAARRGEALNLTWEDVDLEGRTAFLRETKNGRSRKLPLRRELLELLEGLPRPTAKVFSFTLDWLVGSWKRACELADVHNLHVHDCRHESISRVAETGQFGLVDLQAFSGHRDIRMLLRYSHLCATRMAVKLDEAFKDEAAVRVHQGRKYLSKRASIAMKDCVEVPEDDASVALEAQAPLATGQHPTLPSNVILFPGTRTNLGRK
jgi:integrase